MPHAVNWVIIGSGNGLSPIRRHAITRTNAVLLSIRLLGIDFRGIWIAILWLSFKKMHLKMSAKLAAILFGERWVKTPSWHQMNVVATSCPRHKGLSLLMVSNCPVLPWKILRNRTPINNTLLSHERQYSWGQHEAHLGPADPRWDPCWPHEPCYRECILSPLVIMWLRPWHIRKYTFMKINFSIDVEASMLMWNYRDYR